MSGFDIYATLSVVSLSVAVLALTLRLAAARHEVAQARAIAEYERDRRIDEADRREPWAMLCRYFQRGGRLLVEGYPQPDGSVWWWITIRGGGRKEGGHIRRGLTAGEIVERGWNESKTADEVIRERIGDDVRELVQAALYGEPGEPYTVTVDDPPADPTIRRA